MADQRLDEATRSKVRQLEISTRRLLAGVQAGDTRTRRKGAGFEFDQIRGYQQGDDVRFIDWRSSARHNKLLIKEYVEERNRTIILAVDCSASLNFTSSTQRIAEFAAQIASVLALVAGHGSDAVSLVLFSDTIEKVVPVGRGRNHVRLIMETLFTFRPVSLKTNISTVLAYAARNKRQNGILIIISDFITDDFSRYMPAVVRRYDIIAIKCYDKVTEQAPLVGFLPVVDAETGEAITVDFRRNRAALVQKYIRSRNESLMRILKKYGVDMLAIENTSPFMGELIRFFRRRMSY